MIELDGLAEICWFTFLVHENSQQMRFALDQIKPGQKRAIVGISFDDDSRNGPRAVGIASISIEQDCVVVRHLVKHGELDSLHRYHLSLDVATGIVADIIGTREAMNLRRLAS
jgi:hypothetical protein